MRGYRSRRRVQVCDDPECEGWDKRPVPCTKPMLSGDLPWEEDLECQVLVAAWGPMSLEEVGDLWGLSRERVRQIQVQALRKLVARCEAEGLDPREILQQQDTHEDAGVGDELLRLIGG